MKLVERMCAKLSSRQMVAIFQNLKYYIFEILQIATLCLDDTFAHSWHSLNQFHLECFSNRLGVLKLLAGSVCMTGRHCTQDNTTSSLQGCTHINVIIIMLYCLVQSTGVFLVRELTKLDLYLLWD